MTLTVGSLFSGIGGLDLGLERAGMKVIWQSEIDPYCNKVLNKHWPEVTNHGNIKEIDWTTVEQPDVICGGYPCQPFSTAGKRRGTDDPRHLWPWVRDAISALRPTYAILENVRGHLSMGGLQVIGELAEIGYDAEWRVVSAAGVGAPHRRDRIIIVAYANGKRLEGQRAEQQTTRVARGSKNKDGFMADTNSASRQQQPQRQIQESNIGRCSEDVADTNNTRGRASEHRINSDIKTQIQKRQNITQSGSCRCSKSMADTNSRRCEQCQTETKPLSWLSSSSERNYADYWKTEPDVGRVADGIPNRVDRLRGLGNAVVPQVAEYIGRLVMAAHNNS